jgi:voltage-gated potassium channel
MISEELHGNGRVFLFGYGKFGPGIAETLRRHDTPLLIIEEDPERVERARNDGFEVLQMDVTDDRLLERLDAGEGEHLVCVMDDDHLNVFLVLSLRGIYPHNPIFAISDSIYATSKLKMAGANKVIDLYDISANRVHNILNKPIATRFLEGFTDESHEYSFREIVIPEGSFLHGKMLGEVDFRHYGVIFIGMIDVELGHSFIFVTTGLEHKLDSGDILVCIGHEEDLERFEEAIKHSEEPA